MPLSQNVESIAALRAHVEQRLSPHQRSLEALTERLGRPLAFYGIGLATTGWVVLNAFWPFEGVAAPDPAPFGWLHIVLAAAGLWMTTLVLVAENRQAKDAEHRSHLMLQVDLATEQKVAKIIALLEELRRDLPMVHDRVDREAVVMQAHLDPATVLAAIEDLPAKLPPTE